MSRLRPPWHIECAVLALLACLLIGFGSTQGFAQSSTVDTSIIADNQEDTYNRCLVAAELAPESGLDMRAALAQPQWR